MILLVWNTSATARYVYERASPSSLDSFVGFEFPGTPKDNSATRDDRVSARRAPLSLRQKYLLGRRIDINRATAAEISELPGISDAVAAAVVEERERRGGFSSPQDLLSVKGIKGKRLEKILPFLAKMENN